MAAFVAQSRCVTTASQMPSMGSAAVCATASPPPPQAWTKSIVATAGRRLAAAILSWIRFISGTHNVEEGGTVRRPKKIAAWLATNWRNATTSPGKRRRVRGPSLDLATLEPATRPADRAQSGDQQGPGLGFRHGRNHHD